MKKFIVLLVVFAFFFAGCSGSDSNDMTDNHTSEGGTSVTDTTQNSSTDNDSTQNQTTEYPKLYRDSMVNGMPMLIFNGDPKPMPCIGLGTQWLEGNKTATVAYALSVGFRHFDTSHAYDTEANVGEAIRLSGIPRNEIWVTTKLEPSDYRSDRIANAIDRMLARLGLDYVDMLYIHHPYGDFLDAWPYLEQAVRTGKVHHLGLSNFELRPSLIKEVFDHATIKPVIMQVECNPYAQRRDVQQLIKQYGMAQECWFPLGGTNQNVGGYSSRSMRTSDPIINAIAYNHNKSAVQVILRWHLQGGFSAIPGTIGNRDHILQNINVTDFALSDEEMDEINALNKEGFRFWPATYQSMSWIENIDYGE